MFQLPFHKKITFSAAGKLAEEFIVAA